MSRSQEATAKEKVERKLNLKATNLHEIGVVVLGDDEVPEQPGQNVLDNPCETHCEFFA